MSNGNKPATKSRTMQVNFVLLAIAGVVWVSSTFFGLDLKPYLNEGTLTGITGVITALNMFMRYITSTGISGLFK